MAGPEGSSTDEVRALVASMVALLEQEPVSRARRAGELIDTAKGVLSRVRREAIFEATRTSSWGDVAGELRVSVNAVNKAVTAHRRALDNVGNAPS